MKRIFQLLTNLCERSVVFVRKILVINVIEMQYNSTCFCCSLCTIEILFTLIKPEVLVLSRFPNYFSSRSSL